MIKFLRKFAMSMGLFAGLVGSAHAVTNQYYQAPQPSSSTGMALMWLAGQFEIHRSSYDPTALIIVGSTGGVKITYGFTASTGAISGLLVATSGYFNSLYVTGSSLTVAGSSAAFSVGTTNFYVNTSGVGVGISSPSYTFQVFKGTGSFDYVIVNDSITLRGGTYNPPPTDGVTGQVLVTNGSGQLSWTTLSAGNGSPCTVVVGTAGALGVDTNISNTAGFDLVIASYGLKGLTTSATAQMVMCFKNGLYTMDGTTVPAGLTVIALGSVTWRMTNAGGQLVNNYGIVKGIIFDASQLTYTGQVVNPRSNSIMQDCVLEGGQNGGSVMNSRLLQVYKSSNVVSRNLWIKNWLPRQGSNYSGDNNPIDISSSTAVYFYGLRTSSWTPVAGIMQTGFSVTASSRVYVYDLNVEMAASGLFLFNGGSSDVYYDRGVLYVPPGAGGNNGTYSGIWQWDNDAPSPGAGGQGTSTMTVISNMNVVVDDPGAGVVFNLRSPSVPDKSYSGVVIEHNKVTCKLSGTWTFIKVNTNVKNVIAIDNFIDGCNTAISDSGSNDQFTGNLNFFNEVKQ